MSYFALLLLAIGLSFDTFAVSVSGGLCLGSNCLRRRRVIMLTFAFFQGGMTILGWLAGKGFHQLITSFDHWIAFGLLLLIGGKMILDCLGNKEEKSINLHNNKILITAAIATSIDALAVGVSLALVNLPAAKIIFGSLIIAAVTAAAAGLGLAGGQRAGKRLGKSPEVIGGLILIAIGVKILLEHSGIL